VATLPPLPALEPAFYFRPAQQRDDRNSPDCIRQRWAGHLMRRRSRLEHWIHGVLIVAAAIVLALIVVP
jgi:hypothetical protein